MGSAPEAPHDVVEVWCLPLRRATVELADRLAVLTGQERLRASRFESDRARADFVMVRSTLRGLLGHRLGVPAGEVRIETGDGGKPRLPGNAALRFNVSHSSGMAIIGLAHQREIGVDIESWGPAPGALRTMVLTPRESARLQSASDPKQSFFEHWTLKEALVKGLGWGLVVRPRDVEVVPGIAQTLRGFVVQGIRVAGRYSAAVAVQVKTHRPFAVTVYNVPAAPSGSFRPDDIRCALGVAQGEGPTW